MTVLTADSRFWFQERFSTRVVFDAPMAAQTYFRIGGPADALVTPPNQDDLDALLGFCQERGIPWMVMGEGSNLLVSDKGIRGVVIRLRDGFDHILRESGSGDEIVIRAGAGARTAAVCRYAAAAGLAGLGFAVGIPGSLGAGVRMNCGTRLGAMQNVVRSIEVLTTQGQVQILMAQDLVFGYRSLTKRTDSGSMTAPGLILSLDLALTPDDPKRLQASAKAALEARQASQPVNEPSAGCFFKNPEKGPSAGELIEKAGLKGKQIGGAMISPKHANFIVNTGTATARDVIELKKWIQDKVASMFKVELEPEVRIVGE